MINRIFVHTGLALTIAFAVGCAKELNGDQGGKNTLTSFPVQITANFPSDQGAGSQAASKTIPYELSEKVYFEPGDQIALSAGALIEDERYVNVIYTAELDSPQPSATFIREDVKWQYEEDDYYLAAYPAESVNRWGTAGTSACYFRIPQPQVARAGSWDKRAGIIASMSKSTDFTFQHCAAYVKFVVTQDMPEFTSLRVAYPNVAKVLAGESVHSTAAVYNEVRVAYNNGQITSKDFEKDRALVVRDHHLYSFPDTKAEIVYPDNLSFAPGTYYIAVMAKHYPDGLALVFKSPQGTYASKYIDGPFTLAPGDVVTFKTIEGLTFKPALTNHTIWSDAQAQNQGVVFWVDDADPSHGLVVSTCNHQYTQWATSTNPSGATSDDPLSNYDTIVGHIDFPAGNFPAVAYCKSLRDTYGGDWHLPSIEELRILYNSYYGRTCISPLSSPYNTTEGEAIITIDGTDFRSFHETGQTRTEYQTTLSVKGAFDKLLVEIGEVDATLDGSIVSGEPGNLSVTFVQGFGSDKGVTYWTAKESKADGEYQGKNAFTGRFGQYNYGNAVKTNNTNIYVRCIRNVNL